LGIIFLGIGHCANSTPEGQAKSSDRQAINECKRQMEDTLLPASTREATRYMCNGLRNSFVTKYGHQP
jgi:hypothetical protein